MTDDPRFVLVAGTTETARIDGISAAGADPELMVHTPSADAEILAYGEPTQAPIVPVSPSGCPTPAVITRAVRELIESPTTIVDGGLAKPTAAPAVDVGAAPGADVRAPEPVPSAESIVSRARSFGRSLPDEELVIGETIPGGTTTALGVLRALGVESGVSSSLPENPVELKRTVVAKGLQASDLSPGAAEGEPIRAVRLMGDPVLATIVGLVVGASEEGTDVTLAGGTQLLAAGALAREHGVDSPLTLATTSFVADDPTADVRDAAERLDLDVTVTDPAFAGTDHPAMEQYADGIAKEGVGMGGALALARRNDVSMGSVHDRIMKVYDRVSES